VTTLITWMYVRAVLAIRQAPDRGGYTTEWAVIAGALVVAAVVVAALYRDMVVVLWNRLSATVGVTSGQ